MSKLNEKVHSLPAAEGHWRSDRETSGRGWSERAITYAKEASAASAVVKAIELRGGKAVAIQADAADVEAVKSAVEKTVATFGRLDVLVNNAARPFLKPSRRPRSTTMDRVIDINVRGALVANEAALKHMKPGVASS